MAAALAACGLAAQQARASGEAAPWSRISTAWATSTDDEAPWAEAAARGISAPHFGDVLFQHFQTHSFAALTGLMVAQHFNRLGPHANEAELLRGGLLLSYGQHALAEAVFTQLQGSQAPPALRDRVWYLLAHARQQRGLQALAEQALARIQAALPGALQFDRLSLQAQLLLARGDAAGAAAVLAGVQGESSAARFARFNLAVALLRQGDASLRRRGLAVLDALGQDGANDEEQRGLRDRANLARGYAALQDQQPREARAALQRVQLHGVLANQALLGHGWAAMGLNDPKLALVAWQELAARPEGDAAVLEARLAVPYAQGEAGAFATALTGYQQAAAGFDDAQRALAQTLAAVRSGGLIEALLSATPDGSGDAAIRSPGQGSFDAITQLPPGPHTAQLLPLLASKPFHEGLKQLHDLQFAAANAQQWLADLGSFEDMLDQRRIAFTEALPPMLARRGAAAIAALESQRTALAAEVARAEQAADGRAYANAKEQALWQRIARGSETLARVAGGTEAIDIDAVDSAALHIATISERLRLAAGALGWQLAQAQPDRAGAARQALRDNEILLAQARARDAALVQAQQAEPARRAAFTQRIAALRERLQAMLPQVQALGAEQKQVLQAIAEAELQHQQERLVVYAAQAQLAIAQIQDSAQFARKPDAAAKALR